MYHECSSWSRCRVVGRRRIQWPTWSRHGPEIEVYEAIGASGVVTASHAWIEPQSCATTCTGASGLTAAITANRSRASTGSR